MTSRPEVRCAATLTGSGRIRRRSGRLVLAAASPLPALGLGRCRDAAGQVRESEGRTRHGRLPDVGAVDEVNAARPRHIRAETFERGVLDVDAAVVQFNAIGFDADLRLAFEDRRRARALERECQRGLAVAVWDNPLVPDVHDFLFRRPRHRKRAAEKPAPTASKTAEKRGHEGRETADGFSATGEALA